MERGGRLEGTFGFFVAVTALALASAALTSLVPAASPSPNDGGTGSSSPTPSADTVIFGAVGDFDNKAPGYPDMTAEVKRLANRGGMFLLALGDLGYTSNEQGWCSAIKSAFNNTLVVAGNHDTTERNDGDINTDVVYCPFNLDASLTPGPTYGYGISYYFDFPRTNPLVRVILITAGTLGNQTAGQNYASGGAEYNWVVDAVNGARLAGIPWVVAGMHKVCIDAGTYGCEIGHSLFDKMVDLKVDLVLQAHYHSYQRSKQLALSTNCTTIPSNGAFDADCVVASGPQFAKGAGTVDVIDGAGGRDTYAVALNESDREFDYFDEIMGSNGNTQSKSTGHGPIVVTLNATALTAETTLCPLGSGDATTGECPSQAPNAFQDGFTITSGPPLPLSASFTYSPAAPVAGQAVTFTARVSGGTPPYSLSWDFGDGSTGTGLKPSHAYAQEGSYPVLVNVTDSTSQTTEAHATVAVGAPPMGHPTARFTVSPMWPIVNSTVAFDASGSSDSNPAAVLEFRWDWTGDGTFDTSWSAGSTATHAYGVAGTYTVLLSVRNGAGLTDNATLAVPVDGAAPSTSASISGTVGRQGWYRSSVTVTLAATDDVSGVATTTYRLDGGPWQTYATPFMVGEGRHTLDYRSVDRAGRSEPIASTTLLVDTTAPRLAVSPSGGVSTVSTFEVSWSARDDLAGIADYAVRVDGGPFATRGMNTSITLTLTDGEHTIGVRATDEAGNEAWAYLTLRVDTNPFSPTGPLQGAPTYLLIAVAAGTTLFWIFRRWRRAERERRRRPLDRARERNR